MRFEWTTRSHFIMLDFEADPGEREWQISFGCWFFTFWLTAEVKWPRYWAWHKERWKYEAMEVSIGYNCSEGMGGGFFTWRLWSSGDSWDCKTPKWRDGTFHLNDFLLGQMVHTERAIEEYPDVEFPMPERIYHGSVRLFESTWKRPRSPFVARILRADIKMAEPIPHPGKGENSWDQGQDATYSMTCPARTLAEAIGAMVESSMRDRINYGGRNWRPEPEKV